MNDPTSPSATPDFLNHDRPPVPSLTVPRGVTPFHLDNKPVRGRLVRLGPLADALIGRHDYAPQVAALLGQGLALTAGLAAALKFQGSFSLQAKGDGPVGMLLADCTEAGALRGYARADALPEGEAPLTADAMLGQGYLAFTCDQGPGMDRYQGIVAIQGESLAAMTGAYFETSEQLDARVWLHAAKTPAGWRASALILERVAGAGGIGLDLDAAAQQDAWETALALASTITEAEMLDDALAPDRLLYRLFHAEGLMLDRPRPLSYGCRCSRAKLASVLAGFGTDDLDHMAEDGVITMTCEFCNVGFRFQREDMQPAVEG
ncbi:heat-shock protein Hsp33 [Pseudoroseomonas deserti]|uniref:Heat-shock protein Hsp33 n=1 Tax=Teichococcus deserti TaxID=1817963 RepID=A0A1V2GZV1_9PROT|nr:Hsp33 family molecular chaperone HslO [Pseudoroseomonas deserti]ONG49016.1 heat-shock protein Hsp33 [Pseudoroseomonas deserti]